MAKHHHVPPSFHDRFNADELAVLDHIAQSIEWERSMGRDPAEASCGRDVHSIASHACTTDEIARDTLRRANKEKLVAGRSFIRIVSPEWLAWIEGHKIICRPER